MSLMFAGNRDETRMNTWLVVFGGISGAAEPRKTPQDTTGSRSIRRSATLVDPPLVVRSQSVLPVLGAVPDRFGSAWRRQRAGAGDSKACPSRTSGGRVAADHLHQQDEQARSLSVSL